ncbi:MAG: hypothetical protein P4L16_04495 [Chlamydiales bacterium]|nr:hypothetical protein [Chlamydiales bacterium]
MDSSHFKKLALMGIAASLVVGAPLSADDSDTNATESSLSSLMTASELMSKLNDKEKAEFKSLSPEGQALALKLANQTCKGKNSCKGLNSCKTEKNSCAGLGGCKGQSKGPFKDKNVAVEVAAKKMKEKRNEM